MRVIYAAVGVCGALAATGNVPLIGVITVGQLASFLTYANQYTKPFNEISGVVAELQNAVASAKRVFAVIDEPAESDDSHLPELEHCDGTMQLSHVKFSYVPDRSLSQIQPGCTLRTAHRHCRSYRLRQDDAD